MEKRDQERQTVELEAVLQQEKRRIRARTRDLSIGGLCITSDKEAEAGSEWNLTMSLVLPEDRRSEGLALKSRVVWCSQLGKRYQLGLRFLDLDDERNKYIALFLRFLGGGSQDVAARS